MSTAFTNPARATWQSLLNEITLAYSERRQAICQSAYVPEDRDVQPVAYWTGLQSWLETYCVSFIDHDNGPLTEDGTASLHFTLETWRTEAGLHQDGFRRSPLTGGTAYGQMQIGDAIGPWIFEELQKGFGALLIYPEEYTILLINTVFGGGADDFIANLNGINIGHVYLTDPPGLIHGGLWVTDNSLKGIFGDDEDSATRFVISKTLFRVGSNDFAIVGLSGGGGYWPGYISISGVATVNSQSFIQSNYVPSEGLGPIFHFQLPSIEKEFTNA